MQFEFTKQSLYTSPLVAPLDFSYGELRVNYSLVEINFTFLGSYTPNSVFEITKLPTDSEEYQINTDGFADTSSVFNFDSRSSEKFSLTTDAQTKNNDNVLVYDLYTFLKPDCNSSSDNTEYEFGTDDNLRFLNDLSTFQLGAGCNVYYPNHKFDTASNNCYGEPCAEAEEFSAFFNAVTTFASTFSATIQSTYSTDWASSLPTPTGAFNAHTTEAHNASLVSTTPAAKGSFALYTSEDYEGVIATTGPTAQMIVSVFTTERYSAQIISIVEAPDAEFVAQTTEEHEGQLFTTTTRPSASFDGFLNPSGIADLVTTTPLPEAYIDAINSLPTFVQYLNTKFDIAMEHGTRLSIDADLQSNPIGLMGATICTAAELGTMIRSEVLLPVIEYKWYAHKALIGRETSEPLALSITTMIEGAEVFTGTTCIDILKAENMPGHDIYFGAENINRFIGATTCSTQHDTATNFLGYNVVVVDMVGSYTPTNVFDITTGTPTKTFIIEASNVYSYEAATYSKFLSNSFCTQRLPTVRLEIHVCEAIEEASALPYGRYVPTDPPVEPVDPTPPETGVTISVPIKGLYKVINQYSAKLNDGSDVEFQSLSIKCDADSHSWSFTGTLAANQDRSVITPATDGQPIELVVILNSYQWTLLIEGISTTRSFGSTSVSVSGRGVTALLTDPYYSTTSIVQSILQTNQQIAESLVPFDWTIDWALPTWNVPAGTYSHADTTPVVALARHVANCGGMLVPDRTSQKFYAKKRYPVAPWDFGSVTADIIIPDSAIISLVEEPIGQFGYDGVYVHGTTSDGVVALVRKAGTAGSRLVATQSNAMMVDATALHTLGQRVLSGEAPQPTVKRVTTFMDGSVVPLVAIGSLLQVVADGKSTKGIVNSVTVSLTLDNDALKVTQQLGIGESTENTFSLLKALVPTSPLILGKLVSTDGTNSKLDLVNGGTLNARGTGTVGLNYYVMDDVIQSVAPSVTAISDVIV